jgi:uncharacterized protein
MIKGRIISKGIVEGEILLTEKPISFLGGVDPKTGIVQDKESDIYGENIKDKILVFPYGKGSTVGSYVILQLKKNNVAPKGMINIKSETIIAVGAIISRIPLIDKLENNEYEKLKNKEKIELNANEGYIKRLN